MNKFIFSLLLSLMATGSQATSFPFVAKKDSVVKLDSTKTVKKSAAKDTVSKKKETEYEKLVKKGGFSKEGLFTVRHIKDKWYFEVPDSQLGRLLLVVTRFDAVPQGFKLMSGEEVNRSCVYFEQYNPSTIFLREYVRTQLADEHDNIADALSHNTIDPIVYKFDVIGRNTKGDAQLIEVSRLLLSDNKITSFSQSDKSVVKVTSLASDRTFIDTIQTFPINIEIKTLRTYSATKTSAVPATAGGSVTLALNTSMVVLPKNPMRPRFADERVGYFQSRMTLFSDSQQITEHEGIVGRYRLEPKDEKAYLRGKLTEPKKQIVYYIDPATPKKWVPYLKAGINDWNVAFEAAGFKNAIVAKEWPPKDTTASLEDARYCVLRYLPSETENAYGPRIVDPRSGEIIESHICWYHNVMNLLKCWYMVQCGAVDKEARTMRFSDKLMGSLIRFVSSHEVGHTLGLRHNMVASSATPVEKLRDKKWLSEHGHTASIMDYARFNYVGQPEDGLTQRELFPRINDYDKWAIKWGYQWRPEFKNEYQEKKALRSEVTKVLSANPRLRYLGDEGRGQDPRSQTEDLGDNSMKASTYGVKNLKRVMSNIVSWTAQPDGQTDDLENIYSSARSQFMRYVHHVQRNIAGRYTNNWPTDKVTQEVPKARQQEAIQWLADNLFTAPLWLYPSAVTDKIRVNAASEIQNHQSAAVAFLLSPLTISRIQDGNLLSAADYTTDEYLRDVFNAVWKPLDAKDERVNEYRRRTENAYLSQLKLMLLPPAAEKSSQILAQNDNVSAYLVDHLDRIEQFAKAQKSTGINALHYKAVLRKIAQIRKKLEE